MGIDLKRVTYNTFGINDPKLNELITKRDAYLAMFEYLNSNWERCPSLELSVILSSMSLWDSVNGDKAPMDGAVIPEFLESIDIVLNKQKTEEGYRGADIVFIEKQVHENVIPKHESFISKMLNFITNKIGNK